MVCTRRMKINKVSLVGSSCSSEVAVYTKLHYARVLAVGIARLMSDSGICETTLTGCKVKHCTGDEALYLHFGC